MTKATGNPRGRPRKAAVLASIHGDRARPEAPKPRPAAITDSPPELNAEESDYWDRHAPELSRLGRLDVLSSIALADLCRQLVMADMMIARIAADGLTHAGQRGEQVKHPLLSPLATVNSQIAAARAQFGLVPAANERFGPQPVPLSDDIAELLSSPGQQRW